MRICVLGAGLAGVTTTYFLARDGHEVTLVDRAWGPARETSFANGGQISVSHCDPWPSPENLKKVLSWLGRADAPIAIKPSLAPEFLRWMFWFLRNCTAARALANTEKMHRIAAYSQTVLAELRREIGADYDARQAGILHIYRDPESYRKALDQAAYVTNLGCVREPISIERALDIEPALIDVREDLAGVIHAPTDESGDAYKFAENVSAAARQAGAAQSFGTDVLRVKRHGRRVSGVVTSKGEMDADAVVVAMGSYSPLLMKELGLKLPVYPAKGYSVTLPIEETHSAPTTAIIDDEKKLVYSRLGDRLRIAGLAETLGYDTDIVEARAKMVLDGALSVFPKGGDAARAEYWTGLRPQTPDSVPVLGETPVEGLYLNTGHGTLGWTMAAGSARAVADVVGGRRPGIDLSDLGISRFH